MKKKPTLADKIAAWKSAYDIVREELQIDYVAGSRRAPEGEARASLYASAALAAALMAPWNVEED